LLLPTADANITTFSCPPARIATDWGFATASAGFLLSATYHGSKPFVLSTILLPTRSISHVDSMYSTTRCLPSKKDFLKAILRLLRSMTEIQARIPVRKCQGRRPVGPVV
jgi:hypothetical protein